MKKLNYWHLCLAIWLSIASLSCAQNKTTFELAEDEKLIEFTTDRFTLPNLHVTPDGESIIFDVLGDIYIVPIEGGKAEVLLQDNNWKRAGKLSPDGKTLAYVSDETGEFQVWTLDFQTNEKRVYPIKEHPRLPLYAYWKDENNLLIPSKEGLQSFDVSRKKEEIIRPALEEEKSVMNAINRAMSANDNARYAFFQKNGELWAYDVENKMDLLIEPIPDKAFLESIRGSGNGEGIIFYRQQEEDKSIQDLIKWNLTANNLKVLNTIKTLGNSISLNYSFDFIDNGTIILDKEGGIVRMDIETGKYEPIPIEVEVKKVIKKPLRRQPQYIKDSIITASVLRNPVTRKDLDTIYFGAFGKLHSYAKETGMITEVYPEKDRFEVSPSLSSDGKYLAYTTWNDTEMGHVYAREIETGKEYQLTQIPGRYINPAWSPDGTEIIFVADETEAKIGIPRQSGGSNFNNYDLSVLKINVSLSNEYTFTKKTDTISHIYPFSQMPRRFYPVPVYNLNRESFYITNRNHENNLPVLLEIELKTNEVLRERVIPFHTDEVVVSPDAEHIAFILDEQVWIDTFPHTLKLKFSEGSKYVDRKYHYKGGVVDNILLPEAKSVYEVAPSYLYWQDENILMWGSAEEVYTYDVRTGKTEKIADIKVQKTRAVPKAEYALTNARIISMNKQDEIIEKGTILVKDNRIEAVGEVENIVIPESYKVFDLKGKTIIPGLIDVHAHYHVFFPFEILAQENYAYKGNLAYGVTTIYDPSVNVLDYREQAQMVETGQLLGPRVFASGDIITGDIPDYGYKKIVQKSDVYRIVKSNVKLGVSSPLKQYNIKNRKHRQWLYDSAKEYNMTLTNHEVFYLSAISQIIDGYSAMEHEKYSFPLQKDIIELIAQSEIHYTPTFIVSPGTQYLYADEIKKEKKKLTLFNPKPLYYNNFERYNFNLDSVSEKLRDKNIEYQRKNLSFSSRVLKNIVAGGGKVSIGGHGNVLPGIGTHWELWSFAYDDGLMNYEVLKTATINGANKINLQEELGSIETGKLADLVVLNSNPLQNIFNTINVLYTIKNGNVFKAESMKQVYPIEKRN